jgi:hypothetical protein
VIDVRNKQNRINASAYFLNIKIEKKNKKVSAPQISGYGENGWLDGRTNKCCSLSHSLARLTNIYIKYLYYEEQKNV